MNHKIVHNDNFTRAFFAISKFFAQFSLLLMATSAYGSDFHSPRTDALGGAGHASPLLNDAIYLNPSFTSFTPVHSLSLNYLSFGGGSVTTPVGITDFYGKNLNVSVVDGMPESLFQAGVGYTRREDASMIHVGASKSLFQRYGIGLGAKFILPNNAGSKLTDGTFSVSGIASSWFQSALIIDNLFEGARDQGFVREYVLGTKFNISRIILLYLDPHWNQRNAWGYEIGAEFPFLSDIFFRLGRFKNSNIPYQFQHGYGDGYGIGLGWLAPKLSIDYAFSRASSPISAFSHNVGMSIYF